MRTRLVAAVLAVTAVLAGCTDRAPSPAASPTASPTASPAASPTSGPSASPADQQALFDETVAANRAAATAWAQHLVDLVDSVVLPPGAARLGHQPRIFGRGGTPFVCLTDTTLEQVGWWVVDGDVRDVARFLAGHVPSGLHLPRRGIRREVGWPYLDLRGRSPQRDAFTDPCVGLEVRQSGPRRTFVRATTHLRTLGPRDPVTEVVQPVRRLLVRVGTLRSGDVVTTSAAYPGDDPVTRDLVRRLDSLPASAVPASGSLGCPYDSAFLEIRVLIRDGDGRLAAHVEAPFCGGQLEMSRNGAPAVGTLDPQPIYQQLEALAFGRP